MYGSSADLVFDVPAQREFLTDNLSGRHLHKAELEA